MHVDGHRIQEQDLRPPVAQHLAAQGLHVQHEVWINGRIADLYAHDGDRTVAVELKLTDWEQALTQALAYQLGALYSYVALPLTTAPRALRQPHAFKRHGIGLLAVIPPTDTTIHRGDHTPPTPPTAPTVRTLIEARASERYLPFLADKIVQDAPRRKRTEPMMVADEGSIGPKVDPRDGQWADLDDE